MGYHPPFILCTPAKDSVKVKTIDCIERARAVFLNEREYFPWTLTSGDGVARSRCIIATELMQKAPEIPYLIFVDYDITFTPEDLKKLHNDLKAGYDLVGGLFAVRGGTFLSSYMGGESHKLTIDDKVHKFEYIASGFMGISQRLLRKMVDEIPLPLLHPNSLRFYPFFEDRQKTDRNGESLYLSEDFDFCEKARQVGVDPYIDTGIRLGHIGEYEYHVADVLAFQKHANGERDALDLLMKERIARAKEKGISQEGELVEVAG